MKFYTYDGDFVYYKRFRFLRGKIIVPFILIQLCLTIILLFALSNFYITPEEKKLKNDVTYLLNEFNVVNQRIIESDAILDHIIENDSIIYQSIFDVSDIDKQKEFGTKYEDLNLNDYSYIIEETNEKISVLNSKLAKESYLLNGILKTAYSHEDMLKHIPAIQPIDNKNLKRTASGWGYRVHPIYNIRKFHYGLDFTAPEGSPIYVTGDGTIQYVIASTEKASSGYGNLIIVDHGYKYRTLYAHLSKFKVKNGQKVKRGEIIGYVGNTGISTGPHLHYEVIKDGVKINPVNFLFNSLTPEEYQKIIEISNSMTKSYD